MTIRVNGEPTELEGARVVEDIALHFGLQPEVTLIEHNGAALHRREWPERPLRAGDRVEILRVAAGG
jgi:thiamine biosynthesis protein ThiS